MKVEQKIRGALFLTNHLPPQQLKLLENHPTKFLAMKKNTISKPTNFKDLNDIVLNTVEPTILIFVKNNTFGHYWTERIERDLEDLYTPNLSFQKVISLPQHELNVLTDAGGGPVIFFIRNHQIMEKSLGRISRKEFMDNVKKIYPSLMAA